MDLDVTFDRVTIKTPVYIKMDAPEQLLLAEGVCRQLNIISYHPQVARHKMAKRNNLCQDSDQSSHKDVGIQVQGTSQENATTTLGVDRKGLSVRERAPVQSETTGPDHLNKSQDTTPVAETDRPQTEDSPTEVTLPQRSEGAIEDLTRQRQETSLQPKDGILRPNSQATEKVEESSKRPGEDSNKVPRSTRTRRKHHSRKSSRKYCGGPKERTEAREDHPDATTPASLLDTGNNQQ